MAKISWKTLAVGTAILTGCAQCFAAPPTPGGGPNAGPLGSGGGSHDVFHVQMMQGQSRPNGIPGRGLGPGQPHAKPGGFDAQGPTHGQYSDLRTGVALPISPGQDAFGAIQEIVQMLESDPTTDWSKVDIEALRQHLIDMNEVTLHAKADVHMTDHGVAIAVTGDGRTRDAIKRMVPAHVHELAALGWKASVAELPNGVTLTVVANDAAPLARLKGLGFMGIMVQGAHHQRHHLMMAKGVFAH
jgi:hypothetical protein